MSETHPTWKDHARRWLPFVGAALLLGYFFASTDLQALGRAVAQADLGRYLLIVTLSTLAIWLYDSLCLVWLVRTTLGHRGRPVGGRLRDLAPLKAASYILNVLNYHAASLGMAWLIGRRKGVSFLEAAGALALLSYIDLVAVSGMVVAGLWLAPEVVGKHPTLQSFLQVVVALVFGGALASVLILQSGWRLPLLERIRALAVVRPLAALRPLAMLQGLILRMGLVLAYTAAAVYLMRAFGMQPTWGRMFVAMPILTVVGTIPISVSGFGSTQVLMRTLYAPFVTDGRPSEAVIDAYSTAMILGYIACRMVVAAPFFRPIAAELRERPPEP